MRLLTQVLVLCVLSSSAAAQRVPSGKVSGPPTLADLTTGKEMSDCQMAPNVDAAKALLASSTMDEAKRHAARFKWKSCALKKHSASTMTITPNTPKLDELRYMSAEYLLFLNGMAAKLPPIEKKEAYALAWFAATSRDDAIDAMAACVADTFPAGINELMSTQVESGEEGAVLTKLRPYLVSCLRGDVTLNANRKALRGGLVDALYQRARVENPATGP